MGISCISFTKRKVQRTINTIKKKLLKINQRRLLKINQRKVKSISTVTRLLIKSNHKKTHKSKKKTIKPRH